MWLYKIQWLDMIGRELCERHNFCNKIVYIKDKFTNANYKLQRSFSFEHDSGYRSWMWLRDLIERSKCRNLTMRISTGGWFFWKLFWLNSIVQTWHSLSQCQWGTWMKTDRNTLLITLQRRMLIRKRGRDDRQKHYCFLLPEFSCWKRAFPIA